MCGIVGLLLKKLRRCAPSSGSMMGPMLVGMTERGPDSSGMAVFSESLAEGRRKLSLYCATPNFDWPRLERALLELLGDASFETKVNHCIVTTRADNAKVRGWLAIPSVQEHLHVESVVMANKYRYFSSNYARNTGADHKSGHLLN